MAKINYTKTYFSSPGRISEEVYNGFKSKLKSNPNYEIDPNPTTFSEHFKGNLLTIGISFIIMIVGFGAGEGITTAIGGFAMIAFIGMLINLFLEGPSYATYIKEKKEYFSRMKYAIQNTNSYNDFISTFYR